MPFAFQPVEAKVLAKWKAPQDRSITSARSEGKCQLISKSTMSAKLASKAVAVVMW